MQKYAVCEISGKQYLIAPNIPFETDWLGDRKKLSVSALLIVSEKKVELGTPFLKDQIEIEVLGDVKSAKVRVAKYHAKANDRRVTGIRPMHSKVVWNVKSP